MRHINCSIGGRATDMPYVVIDNGHRFTGVFETPSRVRFPIPETEPMPYGVTVFWDGKAEHFGFFAPEQEGPFLQYAVALGRYQADGVQLRVAGKPAVWAMMTGFCDYQLYLAGQRDYLRALWQQARDLGARGRRVLGMMAYITNFNPRAYGDVFYDQLPLFAHDMADYGQRLHFDVYADNQVLAFNVDHFNRVVAKLRDLESVVIGAGNEWPKNGFDPLALPYPGVISSQGSTTSDAAPPMPGWGIRMWHGRRDYPKVFMSADDMVYVGRGLDESARPYAPVAPIVHDEPMGFAEVDIPNRRSTDPVLAQCLMLTGRAYGAGATFHSEDGIYSRLLGPTQQACARAFFDAQG